MAVDKETLEYYLVQIRRIEEHREQGANQKIRQLSRQLVQDLREFLGVEYARLAEDDRLTYAILQQKGEYARFLEEVERKINGITPKVAEEIRSVVNDTYTAAYNGMVKAVEASTGRASLHEAFKGLPLVSPEVIKRAVENPLSGLTLKDTLEKNRKEVIYDIKREIGIGLTQGDRMSTMAKRITDRVDMDYRKAMTIARTEVHRVREAGHYDSAVDIGAALDKGSSGMVMVKIWRTMKDESVRPQRDACRRKSGVTARKKNTVGLRSYIGGPNHVKLEGVTVKVDEPFDLGGGVTATAPGQSGVAGHDINCRCFVEYDLFTVEEYEKATGKIYEKPLTNVVDGGMIEVDDEAVEKVGDTDGYTKIVVIEDIDFIDKTAIDGALTKFESTCKNSKIEGALIISPKNKLYELQGTSFNVNTRLVREGNRKGSISIHNHPNKNGMADCFSADDFVEHFHDKASVSWLISNGVRYMMRYDGEWLSDEEARKVYKDAMRSVQEIAYANDLVLDFEGLEIMRWLAKMLKGMVFDEL